MKKDLTKEEIDSMLEEHVEYLLGDLLEYEDIHFKDGGNRTNVYEWEMDGEKYRSYCYMIDFYQSLEIQMCLSDGTVLCICLTLFDPCYKSYFDMVCKGIEIYLDNNDWSISVYTIECYDSEDRIEKLIDEKMQHILPNYRPRKVDRSV